MSITIVGWSCDMWPLHHPLRPKRGLDSCIGCIFHARFDARLGFSTLRPSSSSGAVRSAQVVGFGQPLVSGRPQGQQPDGKTYLAGATANHGRKHSYLRRYSPGGEGTCHQGMHLKERHAMSKASADGRKEKTIAVAKN